MVIRFSELGNVWNAGEQFDRAAAQPDLILYP